MLSYRLAKFNPQRGRGWGVSLDWFTIKKHQCVIGSKVWGHVDKAQKTMVKGIYQLPFAYTGGTAPREYVVVRRDGPRNQGFSYAKGLNMYHKGIQCMDDVWDSENRDFLTRNKVQETFKFTPTKLEDWAMLISKLLERWRPMLGNDSDTTYAGEWVGYYIVGEEDPTFVLQCTRVFTPMFLHLQHLIMPLTYQCSMVGSQSQCLNEWKKPSKEMDTLCHEVRIIHTTSEQKGGGERRKNRLLLTKRTEGVTNAIDKWQGYLPRNNKFDWSQV